MTEEDDPARPFRAIHESPDGPEKDAWVIRASDMASHDVRSRDCWCSPKLLCRRIGCSWDVLDCPHDDPGKIVVHQSAS